MKGMLSKIHNIMKKIYFILFFSIPFIFSCKGNVKTSDEIIYLTKKFSIEDYGENNFFSNVKCMSFTDNSLYFSDYSNSELYKYSKRDFKLQKVIGGFGDGPGQVNGLAYFYVNNNEILVQNDRKRAFEIFESDVFKETYRIPGRFADLPFRYRFFYDKETLYTTHSPSLSPLLKITLNDNSFKLGGKGLEFKYETQNRIRNNNHVFKFKENIITVSDNKPLIKFYDLDFKLKNEVSLEDYSEVKKTQDYIDLKELEMDDSSFHTLIQDAYLASDMLYILITSYEPYSSNKILVFKLNEVGSLTFQKTLYLNQESNYSTIASDNEILATFNTDNTFVEIFDLKK